MQETGYPEGEKGEKQKEVPAWKWREKFIITAVQQTQRVTVQTEARKQGFQEDFLGEKNRSYKWSERFGPLERFSERHLAEMLEGLKRFS